MKNNNKFIQYDQKPTDPVTENMNILNIKPVKAFIEQDHEAHLAVHQAAIQDPKFAQMVGQNPQAQAIQQAAQAHIMEHMGFQYRRDIEKQLGVSLPDPKEELKPELEQQISQMAAAAAQQVLQQHKNEAQAQQNQQAQQDPVMQMQQKDLQLREQELHDKKEIELKKLEAQKEIAMINNEAKLMLQGQDAKVEGLFKGMDLATKQQEMAAQQPPMPPSPPPNPGAPPAPPMPPQQPPM